MASLAEILTPLATLKFRIQPHHLAFRSLLICPARPQALVSPPLYWRMRQACDHGGPARGPYGFGDSLGGSGLGNGRSWAERLIGPDRSGSGVTRLCGDLVEASAGASPANLRTGRRGRALPLFRFRRAPSAHCGKTSGAELRFLVDPDSGRDFSRFVGDEDLRRTRQRTARGVFLATAAASSGHGIGFIREGLLVRLRKRVSGWASWVGIGLGYWVRARTEGRRDLEGKFGLRSINIGLFL